MPRLPRALSVVIFGAVLALTAGGSVVSNQVMQPGDARVVYGHHHLNVTSIDDHRKFWVDGLGGVETKLNGLPLTIIRFPSVLVLLRQQAPKGDMRASVVPEIGFDVKSLATAVDRLSAAGFQTVRRTASAAIVVAPDGLEVELVESEAARDPIRLRDVQFSGEDPAAMSAWYAKTLGASVMPNGSSRAATLPGLTMLFRSASSRPSGTQGRVLDHIGFEVQHLESFCADLQRNGVTFDRPYTKLPNADLAIAFLSDPWGTYIELTEGLSQVR